MSGKSIKQNISDKMPIPKMEPIALADGLSSCELIFVLLNALVSFLLTISFFLIFSIFIRCSFVNGLPQFGPAMQNVFFMITIIC